MTLPSVQIYLLKLSISLCTQNVISQKLGKFSINILGNVDGNVLYVMDVR